MLRGLPRTENADIDNYEEEIGKLQERYPKQCAVTWIKISVAMRPMFEIQEPTRPAVLLLLTSEQEADTFPRALATMLGKCWPDDVEEIPTFEGSTFENENITSIYNKIENHVKTNHVIIFNQMEKITNPQYLTIFHNLCDNSLATYKRICYILSVTLSKEESEQMIANPSQLEKQKTILLNQKWSNVTKESRAALIARVSPFTIFVVDEKKQPEPFVRATFRETREAVMQFGYSTWSYGYSYWWNVLESLAGYIMTTRRTKFDEFLTKMKSEHDNLKYNKSNAWDIVRIAFDKLVKNDQVYPTVLLVVLSSENSQDILQNIKSGFENIFDCGYTVEFDRDSFEVRLGSLNTQIRNMTPKTTYGHICKDIHSLDKDHIQKLISIFPQENTGTFNNTYWLFTTNLSELENALRPTSCQESTRRVLEKCFGNWAESGNGEYLLEQMLAFTIFV